MPKNCGYLVCFICCKTSLQHVSLKAPFVCGSKTSESDETNGNTFTYWDCLEFCSKLEFDCDNNEMKTLCYKCVHSLKETYYFLKQLKKAHKRMIQLKEETNDDIYFDYKVAKLNEDDDTSTLVPEGDCNTNDDEATIKQEKTQNKLSENIDSDLVREFFNYENDTTLQEHLTSNPESQPNAKKDSICHICNKKFIYTNNFLHHWQKCHSKENQTPAFVEEKTNLQDAQVDDQSTPITVQIESTFMNAYTPDNSSLSIQRFVFKCNNCSKEFLGKAELLKHMASHDKKNGKFECLQCNKMYSRQALLDIHMSSHDKKALKCKMCDKKFANCSELKAHMRFHTGEYPETCEICGMSFAIKSHLRNHLWRHQKEQLRCNKCQKVFKSANSLKKHSLTHKVMPLTCRHCGKGYADKNRLKPHLKRIHNVHLTDEELQKSQNQKKIKTDILQSKAKASSLNNCMPAADDDNTIDSLIEDLLLET